MAVSSAEVLDVMAVGACGSDIHRLRSGFDVGHPATSWSGEAR